MKIIGFMTGTSLDGIDIALIETDGEAILALGAYDEYPIPDWVRQPVLLATHEAMTWPKGATEPQSFNLARQAVTDLHIKAFERFILENEIDPQSIDLIGVHGQTILHQRPKKGENGRTIQLFEPSRFAEAVKCPVISDFRSNDMQNGGEGAPLAPIYHRALVQRSGLKGDIVVVNLGGVANITVVRDSDLIALDTGPANGMMDLWVQSQSDQRYDKDGALAAKGQVDRAALQALVTHDYFKAPAPKSLDRYDFSLNHVKHLSLEDGLATLSAFTRESLKQGIEITNAKPQSVILCGGGRMNRHLVEGVITDLTPAKVLMAEDLGWRGGAIEAEAFAFLAARSFKGLPLSYPKTTGVKAELSGGIITHPSPYLRFID
jgi:anhydro-N-acetylmuramic acid kinase